MRLATSPSLTARISGMPPATAASNARVTPRCRASAYSSAPWCASSALLAVTTCLPAAIARRTKVRAGSSPPISSITIWIAGSSSTRAASWTMGSRARSRPSRGRARSASAMAARVSRAPVRFSRISRWVSRILTTPPPTVPSPSNPILTSRMGVRLAGGWLPREVLEAAERLADPQLVLDEGEPDVAFAVLAEPDSGRHRDLGLLYAELGELERAHRSELLGDGRPDEHRPLGLRHGPALLVEAVYEHVAPLAVDLADVAHDRLVALQRHDARDLDRLEDAVVEIRLDAGERVHHLPVAAAEREPPAGHVVGLGEREQLDTDVLGARRLEERGRPVAVVGQIRVGEVVDDHEPVLAGEVDHPLEEGPIHAGGRRVVREREDQELGL